MFNDTFNNILVISRLSVLLVDEAGIPGENHWPWAVIDKHHHVRCEKNAPFLYATKYGFNSRCIGNRLQWSGQVDLNQIPRPLGDQQSISQNVVSVISVVNYDVTIRCPLKFPHLRSILDIIIFVKTIAGS